MSAAAVEVLVRGRMGLDPATLGSSTLSRSIAARLAARGLTSPEAYPGLLAADPAEWAALMAELVVPETWFFRGGRGLFARLAQLVREKAAGRLPTSPVRVLSAPCSTGEEPYSVAIALEEQGVPPAAFRIDAVDLSPENLAKAAAGRYPGFAFREPVPDLMARYFASTGTDRWEVVPAIARLVRFRPGNLIDPAFLAGEPPYDLILCRNVFIYLTAEARAKVLANFDRLLAPDGRLVLTAAEADKLPPALFTADGPPELCVFRRADAGGRDTHNRTSDVGNHPARLPVAHSASPLAALRRTTTAVELSPPLVLPPRTPPDPLAEARRLADAGQLAEALALCEREIARRPTPNLFTLLGVIHLAARHTGPATEAFRKALYLDPNHADALTHMAVLCEARGDATQAAALRKRLARVQEEKG